MPTEKFKWKNHESESTDAESRAEQPVVATKSWKQDGAKGLCYGAEFNEQLEMGGADE